MHTYFSEEMSVAGRSVLASMFVESWRNCGHRPAVLRLGFGFLAGKNPLSRLQARVVRWSGSTLFKFDISDLELEEAVCLPRDLIRQVFPCQEAFVADCRQKKGRMFQQQPRGCEVGSDVGGSNIEEHSQGRS